MFFLQKQWTNYNIQSKSRPISNICIIMSVDTSFLMEFNEFNKTKCSVGVQPACLFNF